MDRNMSNPRPGAPHGAHHREAPGHGAAGSHARETHEQATKATKEGDAAAGSIRAKGVSVSGSYLVVRRAQRACDARARACVCARNAEAWCCDALAARGRALTQRCARFACAQKHDPGASHANDHFWHLVVRGCAALLRAALQRGGAAASRHLVGTVRCAHARALPRRARRPEVMLNWGKARARSAPAQRPLTHCCTARFVRCAQLALSR
jgi:hypothetical protein